MNDFGVFNLLKREYNFNIAFGRVISNHLMKNAMEMRINSESALRLFNVDRIEISNKGKDMKVLLEDDQKIGISLYYPYLFLTTGRRCMHGFPQFVAKEGFKPTMCGIKCRDVFHKVKNSNIEKEILMIGNTHFLEIDELPVSLENVDRLVYMPPEFFSI